MEGCLKSCLISGSLITGVVIFGGIYLFKELENSPLLDQRLSEQYGLLNCFSKVSMGELTSYSECSDYARLHIPAYPEYMAATPEESMCLTSVGILRFLKIEYPSELDEIRAAEVRAKRNCTSKWRRWSGWNFNSDSFIFCLITLEPMERQKIQIEMKIEHIELLETLKQEYGVQSRARALEMLLDDLLNPEGNESWLACCR